MFTAPPAKAMRITLAGIIAVTVVFAALAYHRRWISDDGLIVVRTVRQILAGNGPVFNAFERAEANTSTLWTWLMVAVAGITRANVTIATVVTGGVLAVAGLAIAMDGARRWHLARGSTAALVPAGALVVLAVFPFWDFATSGLETGLSLCWLATCWWLLVAGSGRPLVFAIVVGLGPLVRPDFALVSGVFLVAGWLLVRPPRRRTLALLAAAIALPVAYEIFRAGYYGTLVPLPALAKSASHARWGRGLVYVWDYAKPFKLWLPLAVLAALAGKTLYTTKLATRDRVILAAPVVAAALMLLYIVRVGGDFMHARMCLPPTFMLLAPVMLLPARRFSAVALGILAVWALAIGIVRGDGRSYASAYAVEDEHYGYLRWTGDAHPIDDDAYTHAPLERPSADAVAAALAAHEHALLAESGLHEAMSAARPGKLAFAAGHLGTGGVIAPLDAIVVDVLGLANPLGARLAVNQPGIIGHEKSLSWAWVHADFADPAITTAPWSTPEQIAAARHVLTCGDVAELLASVREPMSPGRFWDNLTGAWRRTWLEIPSDPIEAERAFCGP